MADSTEGGTGVQSLFLLTSSLITLIAGLVIHLFIIAVNVNDWWKGRSVTPVDHIVTSVCIIRICAQCDYVLYLFVDSLSMKNLYSVLTLIIMGTISTFFTYVNFWLTALLSIVFCFKISNIRHRLFLYLKRVIVQRTVYFIVASVLLSTFSCLIFLSTVLTETTEGATNNVTMDDVFTDCMHNNSIYIYTIGTFFPLLFCCISSVLLFTSLYHHTTRMKMSGNLTTSLETYYSVMKFVSFTIIYNTVYFIVHFASALYYSFYCMSLPWLHTVLGFLPTLHSFYLIYRTSKLRSQMSKVLQNVINSLFQRKDRESRENIEVVDQ